MIVPEETLFTISSKKATFPDFTVQFTNENIREILEIGKETSYRGIERLKTVLHDKITQKVVLESNDHKKPFNQTPYWFKLLTFFSIFTEAYFLMANLEGIALDESKGIARGLEALLILRGKSGFDGAGGFTYDVANFHYFISNRVAKLGEPENKKRHMFPIMMLFTFVLMPITLFGYKKIYEITTSGVSEHYLHLNALLAVINGFAIVALCVLTGVILKYFTFQILKKFLNDEEFKASIDLTNTFVTKREWLIRIAFGISLGILGSLVVPYIKKFLLEKIALISGDKSLFTLYTSFALTGMIMIFGLHLATLRIIIPAITKLFTRFLTYKDSGHPKRIQMTIATFIFYFGAIALFGTYAVLEKTKYFGDGSIIQNVMQQLTLFVAIGLNILGGIFIFKMMSLIVNARTLSSDLLSNDKDRLKRANRRITTNKVSGVCLMLFSLAGMLSSIAIFICGRVMKIHQFKSIIENQWLIAVFTTIFVVVFFASIAVFSRTHFISIHFSNQQIKQGINEIEDILFVKLKEIDKLTKSSENNAETEPIYENLQVIDDSEKNSLKPKKEKICKTPEPIVKEGVHFTHDTIDIRFTLKAICSSKKLYSELRQEK